MSLFVYNCSSVIVLLVRVYAPCCLWKCFSWRLPCVGRYCACTAQNGTDGHKMKWCHVCNMSLLFHRMLIWLCNTSTHFLYLLGYCNSNTNNNWQVATVMVATDHVATEHWSCSVIVSRIPGFSLVLKSPEIGQLVLRNSWKSADVWSKSAEKLVRLVLRLRCSS